MTRGDGFHAWTLETEASLGQIWEGPRQLVCFSRVLNLDFCLPLCPVMGLGLS